MGAHAFQDRVERLAAVVQSQPFAMPKKAEVLTLRRVGIVRTVNKVIEGTWQLRRSFIVLLREVPDKNKIIEEVASDYDFSDDLSKLEEISRKLDQSVLQGKTGETVVGVLEEIASDWSKKSADDGRFMRRLTRRVKEAGDACDAQRIRVLNQVKDLIEFIAIINERRRSQSDRRSKYDTLIDAHLIKYPIAMDYLAR